MFWLFLSATYGACIAQPKQTMISSMSLSPRQAVMARATFGTGKELASRLRLRDANGELVAVHREYLGLTARLRAVRPLKPGTYTVEERGDFGVEGDRIWRGRRSVAHSAWFVAETVEVVPVKRQTESAPEIEWRYGTSGVVMAYAKVDERTAWAELEVKGVGSIDSSHLRWMDGRIRLSTWSNVRCNDTGRRMPLGAGDVEVRVVLRGPEGFEARSPWTTIAPGGKGTHREPPPAGPPTGKPAKTDALETWTAVEEEPTGPLVAHDSQCGALERFEEKPVTGRLILGGDGAFHTFDPPAGTIDGLTVKSITESVRAITAQGPSLYVVESTPLPTLHHIRSGSVVASVSLTVDGTFGLEADGETVTVRSRERSGHRWSQRFTSALEPLEDPIEILDPIQVDRRGGDMTINGRVVPARRLWVWGDRVAAARLVGREEDAVVDVYDAQAKPLQSIQLPDVWVNRVAIAPEGVLVRTEGRSSGDIVERGYDSQGAAFEIDAVPREPPRALPGREPLALGSQRVFHDGQLVAIGDEQGRFTPPLAVRGQVGVRGDIIEVARRNRQEGRRTVLDRYRCGGEPKGVPLRWLP